MVDAVISLEPSKPLAAAPPPRRVTPLTVLFSALLLVGFVWVLEVHAMLSRVLPIELQGPKCEYLNHRDPGFVRDETKRLCLSEAELAAHIRDIVFTAASVFEAHNVTYFLESGTLLGAFREQRVIRHDKDADLGIDAASLAYLQRTPVAVPDAYHLTVWNSSLYPGSSRDDALPVRVIHKETALYADVFVFLDWRNATTGADEVGPLPSMCFSSCKACPEVDEDGRRHFKVPRDWVYPLRRCRFEGRLLQCPRESAKYLEYMYGKNYMTPSHWK